MVGVQERQPLTNQMWRNLGAMSVESWDIYRCGAHSKHCLVKGEGQEGRQPTRGKQFSSPLRCGQQEDSHRHCVRYRVYEDAGS